MNNPKTFFKIAKVCGSLIPLLVIGQLYFLWDIYGLVGNSYNQEKADKILNRAEVGVTVLQVLLIAAAVTLVVSITTGLIMKHKKQK